MPSSKRSPLGSTHPAATTLATDDGPIPSTLPRVAAWLTPRESARVEATGQGHFVVVRCPTIAAARDAVAAGNADILLLSAALVLPHTLPALRVLVPRIPSGFVVGLIDEADEPQAIAGTFVLGRIGIGCIIDARSPGGWAALRATLSPAHAPDSFMRGALAAVLAEIFGNGSSASTLHESTPHSTAPLPSDGLAQFLTLAFTPGIRTAREVARSLGVVPSSLTSRFFRAGLPSPKAYIVGARLIYFAHLAERPGISITAIAHYLDASSPQAFHRMVRRFTGLRAMELRRTYTGAAMLERFLAELIRPYSATLRTFDPLAATWHPETRSDGCGRVAS